MVKGFVKKVEGSAVSYEFLGGIEYPQSAPSDALVFIRCQGKIRALVIPIDADGKYRYPQAGFFTNKIYVQQKSSGGAFLGTPLSSFPDKERVVIQFLVERHLGFRYIYEEGGGKQVISGILTGELELGGEEDATPPPCHVLPIKSCLKKPSVKKSSNQSQVTKEG